MELTQKYGVNILGQTDTKAYVYMVSCSDGTWYTGWTTNPQRRVKTHNSGKGAKYTRSRLPVELIYTEQLPDRRSAMRREYEIKQMSRKEKENLVYKRFPANERRE